MIIHQFSKILSWEISIYYFSFFMLFKNAKQRSYNWKGKVVVSISSWHLRTYSIIWVTYIILSVLVAALKSTKAGTTNLVLYLVSNLVYLKWYHFNMQSILNIISEIFYIFFLVKYIWNLVCILYHSTFTFLLASFKCSK